MSPYSHSLPRRGATAHLPPGDEDVRRTGQPREFEVTRCTADLRLARTESALSFTLSAILMGHTDRIFTFDAQPVSIRELWATWMTFVRGVLPSAGDGAGSYGPVRRSVVGGVLSGDRHQERIVM
jgi:hypothetical protein